MGGLDPPKRFGGCRQFAFGGRLGRAKHVCRAGPFGQTLLQPGETRRPLLFQQQPLLELGIRPAQRFELIVAHALCGNGHDAARHQGSHHCGQDRGAENQSDDISGRHPTLR